MCARARCANRARIRSPSQVPSLMSHSPHLQAALDAADAASQIIRKAYRGNFEVEFKADQSPVTEVDIAAEKAIRGLLSERFPDYGFYGEETGRSDKESDYLWLVDPIDGTKSFVRGYPVFSVQIALMHQSELVVGVSSAPCWNGGQGEICWAEKGEGAFLDGEPIRLAAELPLEKATLSTGNIASLAGSPAWERFGRLIPKLHRIRGYGDFLHYHLLASGKLDVVLESDLNILDIAALTVVVREAGGVVTDLRGGPVALDTTTLLAAAPNLHHAVLGAIAY